MKKDIKMSSGTKIFIAIAGLLTLGIGGYFIYKKMSESKTGTTDNPTQLPETPEDKPLGLKVGEVVTITKNLIQTYNNIFSKDSSSGKFEVVKEFIVSYVVERITGSYNLLVHIKNRPPASSVSISSKSYIQLSNMGKYNGTYKVNSTYTDEGGDLGAFYVSCFGRVTTNNDNNTTWDGVGTITLLKEL